MSSIEQKHISEAEIHKFIELIGLKRAAPGRYSALLVANLLGSVLSGTQNPTKIVHEIELLERGNPGQFKKPIQNKHPALKGLWHKHYMQDGLASMAQNIQKGLNWFDIPLFKQMIQDAENAGEERFVEPRHIPALAADIVSGSWQRLAERQALSGEWIVFAKHEGQNYYLTIATHDSDTHQHVRDHIDQVCCVEFPFLSQLLADAEKS
ncbi:hypothetical protein [Pseudomonas sp. F1002]|uniref:hypothetical protein n=1 Tax=Pseudomonas sp. F1002 TaxID=2738821 RepID=UPI0015A1C4BC|nr:hypothetical protein [Pseudomonas sp. F1002]NWB63902.1 hypothetical protein [Pseudomonas sp. F1002]